jgi:hypothetical protein
MKLRLQKLTTICAGMHREVFCNTAAPREGLPFFMVLTNKYEDDYKNFKLLILIISMKIITGYLNSLQSFYSIFKAFLNP